MDLTEKIKEERFDDSKLYAAGQVGRQPGRGPGDEELDKVWHLENFAHQPIRNFTFVEHADQGDLNMWLSKASRSGTRWPVRAIWMLFKSRKSPSKLLETPAAVDFADLTFLQLPRDSPEWDILRKKALTDPARNGTLTIASKRTSRTTSP